MGLRRTSHAVYDSQYHLVWAPKYRKWILRGDLREYVGKLFHRIAEDFGFDIQEMEVAEDHVHIFLSFPPRYSISKVVGHFEEYFGQRGLPRTSRGETGVMGWRILGRWLFCPHRRRQGDF